jgi:homoaconitase/3-isopropylmalate dehydratase large subunit
MAAQTLTTNSGAAYRPAESDGTALIHIDRHLVHEVTSPQASKAYA